VGQGGAVGVPLRHAQPVEFGELIASDPGGNNGAESYTYDAVGNRKTLSSTIPSLPGILADLKARRGRYAAARALYDQADPPRTS
jgi:hypothetical protein